MSSSLGVYARLISKVDLWKKQDDVAGSTALSQGLDACKAKLLKFFDKSTFDSEYYYFATGIDLSAFHSCHILTVLFVL